MNINGQPLKLTGSLAKVAMLEDDSPDSGAELWALIAPRLVNDIKGSDRASESPLST